MGESADPLLVRSVDALPGAMVRIEATGPFAPPPGARPEDVGHGSGFLVDPSGLIVTNSHVVTGANTVTVWVGSELTKQTADVLGVSECSDLAVIKLQGRRDLPYLDWYAPPIASGLSIHAVGYPIESTEAKVIPGVVEGALGPADAARLSVKDTIELQANIPAGSSGGPVVTGEGQVVAVTYPRDDTTKPPFAISRDSAQEIVDLLQAHRDVTSVGINGYALKSDPKSGPAGIWVVAVKPGSVAAASGILPGDVVTDLAGTAMAADGTMAGYCDVLSGYHDGDALPFSVYRADDRANLNGTLNGKAIEPDFAFAVALGGRCIGPWTGLGDAGDTPQGQPLRRRPAEVDDRKTTRGSSTTRGSGRACTSRRISLRSRPAIERPAHSSLPVRRSLRRRSRTFSTSIALISTSALPSAP